MTLAEAEFGHVFRDAAWRAAALDRTRLGNASPGGRDGFERLEFLGDRILALIAAESLLDALSEEDEGKLARRLAHLVSRDSLAGVARKIGLAGAIKFARGEEDAPDSANVLADALEALIGAIYRDGGLGAARAFILRHFDFAAGEAPRDPKTTLQEWAQGRGLALPVYREVARGGPPHAPHFTVEVAIAGHDPATGEGASKRVAEQAAAAAMMERLKP